MKVLGAGSPVIDYLAFVEESFLDTLDGEKGGMELLSSKELQAILSRISAENVNTVTGGSAANTIFGLAKLGIDTAFLGKIGKDENGKFFQTKLEAYGGDSGKFKIHDTAATGACLSMITADSERTMRTDLGAAAMMEAEDLKNEDFENIDHVHIEGYLLFNEKLIRKILELAKSAESTVSLDLASFEVVNATKSILPEIFSYVDMIFANIDEAEAFTEKNDPESCLKVLAEHASIAAVKLGAEGAWIQCNEKKIYQKAFNVEAVDSTGAGDLWASGFLFAYLNNMEIEKAAEMGALTGAEVVQIMGAEISDEKWKRIKKSIIKRGILNV